MKHFRTVVLFLLLFIIISPVFATDKYNMLNGYFYNNCTGDDVGQSPRPLAVSGSPTNYSLALGSGCAFSGTQSFTNSSYNIAGAKTIEIIFNKTSLGSTDSIFCPMSTINQYNDCIYMDTAGKLYSYSSNNSAAYLTATDTIDYSAATLYHFMEVYNGTHVVRYLNDNKLLSKPFTGDMPVMSTMKIGIGWDGNNKYNGQIGRITIFNKAFNSSEVTDAYNSGSFRNWLTYNSSAVTVAPTNAIAYFVNDNSSRGSFTFNDTQIINFTASNFNPNATATVFVNGTNKGSVVLNNTSPYTYNFTITGLTPFYQYSYYVDINNSAGGNRSAVGYFYYANQSGVPNNCTGGVTTKKCTFSAGSIALSSITGCI